MNKSPGSKRVKKSEPDQPARGKKTQMPSAFELAALACSHDGDLGRAFRSYLSAEEYLKTNGPSEVDLRKGGLPEKVKAFTKLRLAGAFSHQGATVEYQRLAAGLNGYRRLYKDNRDDGVKSAVKIVTGRPCNYQTARDHLKEAWLLKPSRYTPPVAKSVAEKITAANPWDRWCDRNTLTGGDKGKRVYRYLLIPVELLEAALRLICSSRKILTEVIESALDSAAAMEHAHPGYRFLSDKEIEDSPRET